MMIRLVARSSEIGFKEFFGVEAFATLMLIHQPIHQAIAKRRPEEARQAMIDHFAALRRTIGA
jgi:DNA-binding FadR family transcriptional regulator